MSSDSSLVYPASGPLSGRPAASDARREAATTPASAPPREVEAGRGGAPGGTLTAHTGQDLRRAVRGRGGRRPRPHGPGQDRAGGPVLLRRDLRIGAYLQIMPTRVYVHPSRTGETRSAPRPNLVGAHDRGARVAHVHDHEVDGPSRAWLSRSEAGHHLSRRRLRRPPRRVSGPERGGSAGRPASGRVERPVGEHAVVVDCLVLLSGRLVDAPE